ncbi:hypothetical protein EOE18_08635 [Novosphingobium umbonatum]|uniref:Uncharacterized protein n=1 Tax=Novosphingobium umbonatum TaxID=1908524 RepID=A0A3S2URX8_9SPHN|nr:hypothetical protein [Novosphingobium umbonatum]RVU05366.1 hypothetical protein EOE18_08635 [Novosphingobium umbonatum]
MTQEMQGLIHHRKGRPMVMLGMVLTLWVGGRVVLAADWRDHAAALARVDLALARPEPLAGLRWAGLPRPFPEPAPRPRPQRPKPRPKAQAMTEVAPSHSARAVTDQPIWSLAPAREAARPDHVAPDPAPLPAAPVAPVSRWSGDAWLAARRGGDHAVQSGAAMAPSYGANQIGGVLRYRLDEHDRHRSAVYVRAYRAMNGAGETEGALGVSLRPLPKLPVLALVELRASQFASGETHPRPAVSLVSQWQPLALGGGFEAESYAQAGYVGGRAATPFVDGQMRVERLVQQDGGVQLWIGAGAWGGAQQGAGRLDIGPTARLSVWSYGAGGRLSLDWRFRVAGQAMPDSGPALTLSAGF